LRQVHKQFVVAEIFLILNFLNILRAYLRIGARLNRGNFLRLVLLEAPVARLPLAVLFIDVLHNGAVAFHVHGTAGRLLANIFIWIILLFGGLVVVWFRDWVFGLALAYHTLSLAIEQLEIKVIALQWIFGTAFCFKLLIIAFVISGVIALLSLLVMLPQTSAVVDSVTAESQERVDSGADETSRLLGNPS